MLGKRLIKLRGERTQQFIAEELQISRARYSHYENNYAQPDIELLKQIAEYYGVSIDYLLGRIDTRFNLQRFFRDLKPIPIDEVIHTYPLSFEGAELSDDDKRAILTFIKTLIEFKNNEK